MLSHLAAFKSYLKLVTKLCLFNILNACITPKIKDKPKSLIILRTDAIGDYLLFCNFFIVLREHYKDYSITLLGNIAYKDLCLSLNQSHINHFIFFNHKKFMKNPLYSIKLLRELKSSRYEILLNPLQSRDFNNTLLAKCIYARAKYAPSGDCINLAKRLKDKSDRIYTRLFKSKDEIMFEFYRNKEFIENLFNKEINISARLDSTPFKKLPLKIENYSILFIGASASYRKWSVEKFAKIGIYLAKTYNQNILICGGKEDMANADIVLKLINKELQSKAKIINLAGKTSLTELGSFVYNGNLVISNETSCAHLSALLDTATIAVYNGNHLGRFIPYPQEISDKYRPVFHRFITANPHLYKELSNRFAYKSELNINEIEAKDVMEQIDLIFKTKEK